jgi:hypothetical protein
MTGIGIETATADDRTHPTGVHVHVTGEEWERLREFSSVAWQQPASDCQLHVEPSVDRSCHIDIKERGPVEDAPLLHRETTVFVRLASPEMNTLTAHNRTEFTTTRGMRPDIEVTVMGAATFDGLPGDPL